MFPIDATEWRMWINVHMNHFRHGLLLEDLAQPVRDLALGIVRETLSARGFHQARSIMRINGLLAELTGDYEAFGEWPYFISIFGTPDGDQPWGWQIDGHHLCVNALVFDGRLVMTPTFMGAEPRRVRRGPLAGTSLFDPEEALGLDLIRSFDAGQRSRAVIYPSIHPDDIPPHLQNLFDGRMQAGAFHDNLVAPYQGVAGGEMTDPQRRVLLALAGAYVGWSDDGHARGEAGRGRGAPRRDVVLVVRRHRRRLAVLLPGPQPGDPDRVRPPSRRGLRQQVPSRHHVHTVVRTPNGGDYGADLLRQHHERFDHTQRRHA